MILEPHTLKFTKIIAPPSFQVRHFDGGPGILPEYAQWMMVEFGFLASAHWTLTIGFFNHMSLELVHMLI